MVNPCSINLEIASVPVKTIADFMGDTEKTVRENYLHLSPDYLRSAINRQK